MVDTFSDAQRMELRAHVTLAGELVAPLWPMRTFISRNPLQGFEHYPFEEGLRRAESLFGASGYLPNAWYREAWEKGLIDRRLLDEALLPLTSGMSVPFGARRVSDLEILRTIMVYGLREDDGGVSSSDRTAVGGGDEALARLSSHMKAVLNPEWWDGLDDLLPCEPDEWPTRETMAAWCDRTLGTDLTEQINRQLIKWCSAYCDEGEAAWAMPYRDRTFFRSWKAAAQYDLEPRWLGIAQAGDKIRALPDRPEDALLQSLAMLKVPAAAWQDYLAHHLVAMPGWGGFIKWRDSQTTYPWQDAFRIDLVKYLAVRLFYERELVAARCRELLDREGTVEVAADLARRAPHAMWLRRALTAGSLPPQAVEATRSLRGRGKAAQSAAWEELGTHWYEQQRVSRVESAIQRDARLLRRMAAVFGGSTEMMLDLAPNDLTTLLQIIRSFPPQLQAVHWLRAYERTAQQSLLAKLQPPRLEQGAWGKAMVHSVRPLAQLAFCIDVRSEVFRRHLEQCGAYETLGFAGFFGLPIACRSLDEPHEAELCPVLLKPKHVVREVPRTYQRDRAERRRTSTKAAKTAEELVHDLKHNIITPYVMVEAIGWFFGWALFGKTLFPSWYHRVSAWWKRLFVPAVATTLTVDKLTSQEAAEMVAAEQRIRILGWLRRRPEIGTSGVTPEVLEGIRLQALEEGQESRIVPGVLGDLLVLSKTHEEGLLDELRRECGISPRDMTVRLNRATRTGFTPNEQAYYIETSLRMMGLTGQFSRLVFLCGHGSTSQNNPYESALDCGACGGSHGLPNARVFAMIANRPQVREVLALRGIKIPSDTHFVAALHDTTTDRVTIADLEDVPATHRKELMQVVEDLEATAVQAAAERFGLLEPAAPHDAATSALRDVERRSLDWAQVRPEWGLAGNHAFIIGRRALTRSADLGGRSFLHSYDYAIDEDGKLLETIMTAPLIVAQWINMEYYFSAVNQKIFGSGSKVYHNVVGRIGVMSGNLSDLRMGLPEQTVFDGPRPYHQPMRLTAIVEAPPDRITGIIAHHPLLQRLFNNQWVWLIACDPATGSRCRYNEAGGWVEMATSTAAVSREVVATRM